MRRGNAQFSGDVGWVERSDIHQHQLRLTPDLLGLAGLLIVFRETVIIARLPNKIGVVGFISMMGIASLHPSYTREM
jgi:hypothetical protein